MADDRDSASRPRTFQCRDALWEIFERLSRDKGEPVDALVNEAMTEYAGPRRRQAVPTTALPGSPLANVVASATPLPRPSPEPERDLHRVDTPLPASLMAPRSGRVSDYPSAEMGPPTARTGPPSEMQREFGPAVPHVQTKPWEAVPLQTSGSRPGSRPPPPPPPRRASVPPTPPNPPVPPPRLGSVPPAPRNTPVPPPPPPRNPPVPPPPPPRNTPVPPPPPPRNTPVPPPPHPGPPPPFQPVPPPAPPASAYDYAPPVTKHGPPPLPGASEASPVGTPHPGPSARGPSQAPGRAAVVPSGESSPGRVPLFAVHQGQRVQVAKDRFIIGRGSRSTDLTIKDAAVSRQHAMVEWVERGPDAGKYFMVDLGSTNGVVHMGRRVDRKEIAEGDTFDMSGHIVSFTYR